MTSDYSIIDDEVRARFHGLSDDEIMRIYRDNVQTEAELIRFDDVDIMLAKISRHFGYAGLVDWIGEKPSQGELSRILNACEYLDMLDDQRRDIVVMISAPEAQKSQLASQRQRIARDISRSPRYFKKEEL